MAKLTVTEALAEVKTIQARIEKKRASVMRYFARDTRTRDPLEKDGGSAQFIARERQGISDLEERLIRIRGVIQEANQKTPLTVQGKTRPTMDWLNWRREVSTGQKSFLATMTNGVSQIRNQAQKQGIAVRDRGQDNAAAPDVSEFVINVGEQELAAEVEMFETTLGELDGKLSLMNATTSIEVE